MLAAAALLLMAVGALISRLFLKDDQISAVFYPDKLPEKHQIIPESPALEPVDSHAVQPVPGNEPLQPESSGREDLSIRNEMDSKSPAELLPPAGQTETPPADTAASSSKDIPGADMELPQKTELSLSENTESGFLPYSLRSSSYKQPFRAERELAEIRQMGLTPYLVRADLGEVGVWWRVYIGFYATDEAALKAKALYNLSHVTIQKTDYACQLGEFSAETELSPLFDKLKQTDFFPYVIQKGKDSFLLYVGAYERKRDAESDHRKLLKKGFNNNIVKR
jgi:cell division protein FtsN